MNLLGFLADPDSLKAMGRDAVSSANRGIVAGLLGAPVDAATGPINALLMGAGVLGHEIGLLGAHQLPQPIEKPVGGSEWWGDRMQDAGMVQPERNRLAEGLMSVASPLAAQGMMRAGRSLSNMQDAVTANASAPRAAAPSGSRAAQRGAIGLDLNAQTQEIREALKSVPKGKKIGLRMLPDDVPTPAIGEGLRPSMKWVDGVQTNRPLSGTSAMALGSGSDVEIAQALKRLGVYNSAGQGYYPGNKLALVLGSGARKGEDAGEVLLRDAMVHWLTDPPLGPR